jgi:site-specific DNA-methyltransferase (adenine-specific)
MAGVDGGGAGEGGGGTDLLTDPLAPVLLNQDCRDGLREMAEGSVHCVVTSPPYWGLRDYGLGADQLGLEKTPEEYIANLVGIFREVRRVLRDDGTLWINIGDSMASSSTYNAPRSMASAHGWKQAGHGPNCHAKAAGLKPKDLIGIPWRLAFALQADGWWLRSDIIWAKPNPMPESVTDRPTKSHEYLFLLAKSARYYYDQDAIREPQIDPERGAKSKSGNYGGHRIPGMSKEKYVTGWRKKEESYNPLGRNRRSVWTIPTEPYPDAHFATFPRALVEPCILAGCPERVCPVCGKPWVRMTEKGEPDREWQARCGADSSGGYAGQARKDYAGARAQNASEVKARILAGMKKRVMIGFRPTCSCAPVDNLEPWNHEFKWLPPGRVPPYIPGLVFDPFAGRGTVLKVSWALGRRSVGFELSPAYHAMALRYLHGPLFAQTSEGGPSS